jgi:nucleoid-associated protein YgaU
MRKDVKFGLTVGAILVATVVVYVVVLTRSGGSPSSNSLNTEIAQTGNPGDKTAAEDKTAPDKSVPGDLGSDAAANTGAGHYDSRTNGVGGTAPAVDVPQMPGAPVASAPPDSATPTNSAAQPIDRLTLPAATEPSAVAETRTDWNTALNSGPQMLSTSAPQRTQTPTIDSSVQANRFAGSVNRNSFTPMIDSLPTTQPAAPVSSLLTANTPTYSNGVNPMMLSAPAVDPPANAAAGNPETSNSIAGNPGGNNSPGSTSAGSINSLSTASADSGSNSTPRTHRITSGETLSSISAAVYGNAKFYERLLAANPGVDAKHLRIGTTLIIPEVNDDADRNSSAAAPASGAARDVDSSAAYLIKSGDTLEKISRHLYGDGKMQEKIYQLNKTLIGPDENVLKIGWVLKLPEAPTAAR